MAEMTRACSSSHDEGVLDCPCSAPAPLAPSYLDLEAKLDTAAANIEAFANRAFNAESELARELARRVAAEARAASAVGWIERYNSIEKKLAAAEAKAERLAKALRHCARELQYVLDADPCEHGEIHQSGEAKACVALAESLLGPMRGWPEEPNAGMRATLAEVGGGGEVKTPEHVYSPSCARCRDEAGKDRAKVPDEDLCAWHTTDALTTLRAENERLRTAATEALAVLTRLADAGLPVPLGADVDAAKARLAGVLRG